MTAKDRFVKYRKERITVTIVACLPVLCLSLLCFSQVVGKKIVELKSQDYLILVAPFITLVLYSRFIDPKINHYLLRKHDLQCPSCPPRKPQFLDDYNLSEGECPDCLKSTQ